MEYFLSKKDLCKLLVVDEASARSERKGRMFRVTDDTWSLIWSGWVNKEFLADPEHQWESVPNEEIWARAGEKAI